MRNYRARLRTAAPWVFAAAIGLVASAAAAGEACTPGKTHKIAFMLKQQTAFRYLNADIPFFKKTAEATGYQVIVQSAENDAQNQIAQAENVITQGVDAIVIQPVDFHVAAGIAEMATKAGIPLASYDDLILGAKQAGYIGRDPKDGGAAAARAVVAVVPKGNYVLVGGDAGQTGSTLMQEGYHVVLDPLVAKGDVKIVMDQFTPKWKTEPAQANAENALTANKNKVDAFLVSYDGMSLGVLQAIEAAGIKAGSILVTGQDMELAAAQAIVEGRQFGSLWPAPDEMAIAGAKAAVAMAGCKDVGATTTADNGAGQIPWVKTPIYLVGQKDMASFVCKHPFWLNINEVYKNVPDKKPTCG
ncbi:xylose-binding protein [Rhizobiales bacterium GAS191]|jgi:D-xylose transport system substrate-binding protein|nr:xylose-binding protein [Rhizobiales bacterium GAS113]SEE68581.1 xylose-binding protein [Rhizobiales bacterium GAS191]SEF07721.1 xylose-binding protein [Rhizobiales bacterium GAS188]